MKKFRIILLIMIMTMVSVLGFTISDVKALNCQVLLPQPSVEIPMNPDKNPTVAKIEKKSGYKKETKEKPEEKSTEELIIEKCNEIGVDSSIPVAISKLETGYFTSNAHDNYNNPGGIMIMVNGSYELKYFNTIEEGVDYFVSNLVDNYFSVGLYSAEEIGPKYCPGDAGWIRQINILKD